MEPRRVNIINTLQLIASIKKQEEYNFDVPIANVAVELVNQWFDDSFLKEFDWFREYFSDDEWSVLSEFDDFYNARLEKLPNNYAELQKNIFWGEIVDKANWALIQLGWQNFDASYD